MLSSGLRSINEKESHTPKLLVFDLDGTLIDSRRDLVNSVNATLLQFGKQGLADDVVTGYIGDGAGALVRRALAHAHVIADEPDPHDDAFVQMALEWFICYYKIHKLDHTVTYPGVMESLQAIRDLAPQLPMAVLTNKPVIPSIEICRQLGLAPYFFANYGGNSFATKKPDPLGLMTLLREASQLTGQPILASEAVMIGDSHVDVETARACGTRSLGCRYGLSPDSLDQSRPDVSVDSASDWPCALGLESSVS